MFVTNNKQILNFRFIRYFILYSSMFEVARRTVYWLTIILG